MKKVCLALILVICLVLGSAMVAVADSGFHFGLGYEEDNNTVTLDPTLSIPLDLTLDVSMPCTMYTVDLGYDFNDNVGIEGMYSWGSTDVIKVNGGLGPIGFSLPVTMDKYVWRIEGVYKFPVGDGFKIGGIIGYLDSDSKLKAKLNATGIPVLDADVKQEYEGVYLGILGTFNPSESFELGASFRYLISPSGKASISWAENGLGEGYSVSMNDFTAYILEIYGKAALTPNWSAQAGYTYTYADYSLSIPNTLVTGMDVTNKTSGLWVKMTYKF